MSTVLTMPSLDRMTFETSAELNGVFTALGYSEPLREKAKDFTRITIAEDLDADQKAALADALAAWMETPDASKIVFL
jgi:hypothetical protein